MMINLMETNPEKETLGQYLKRERQFRAISLEEIASTTRIPMRHLFNIEADALETLPPKTFVKGYLRAYSHHIGLDGDQVILRYESTLNDQDKESEENQKRSFFGLKKLFNRSDRINIIIYPRH